MVAAAGGEVVPNLPGDNEKEATKELVLKKRLVVSGTRYKDFNGDHKKQLKRK